MEDQLVVIFALLTSLGGMCVAVAAAVWIYTLVVAPIVEAVKEKLQKP